VVWVRWFRDFVMAAGGTDGQLNPKRRLQTGAPLDQQLGAMPEQIDRRRRERLEKRAEFNRTLRGGLLWMIAD